MWWIHFYEKSSLTQKSKHKLISLLTKSQKREFMCQKARNYADYYITTSRLKNLITIIPTVIVWRGYLLVIENHPTLKYFPYARKRQGGAEDLLFNKFTRKMLRTHFISAWFFCLWWNIRYFVERSQGNTIKTTRLTTCQYKILN